MEDQINPPAAQHKRHRWQKGESGNPGGRPKGLAAAVKDLVGTDGRKLIDTYWKIWNGQVPEGWKGIATKDRLEAGRWLSDRGFGKALDITSQLSPEQAGALLDLDDQTLQAVVAGIKSHLVAVKGSSSDRAQQAADGQQARGEIPRKVA